MWCKLVQQIANGLYNLQIRSLVASPNIVRLPDYAALENEGKSLRVVFNIKPVANISAVTVNRQSFACQSFDNRMRNQLFREMVRTIIVRTIGKKRRQPIGFMPGPNQMVRRGLACRVRRVRSIG